MLQSEEKVPVWYIMDEFGSRVQHSSQPTCCMAPLFYAPKQIAYLVLWPQDLENYVELCIHKNMHNVELPILREFHIASNAHPLFSLTATINLPLSLRSRNVAKRSGILPGV